MTGEGTRSDQASRVLAALVLALCVVVAAGWLLGLQAWSTRRPHGPGLTVDTALCLAALAGSLLARRRLVVPVLTLPAGVLAAASLVAHLTPGPLGPGGDPVPGSALAPGAMAWVTAVLVLLLVVGRLLLWRGHEAAAAAVAASTVALAATVELGHLYRVEELSRAAAGATVSLPTAVCVSLLGVATWARVRGGVVWQLLHGGDDVGSTPLRRIVPIVLVVLPLIGWVGLEGASLGWWSGRFAAAVSTSLSAVVLTLGARRVARRLADTDERRRGAIEELAALNASLEEGRDTAWRRAEQLAHELVEERARFNRAISKLDDLVGPSRCTPVGWSSCSTPARTARASSAGRSPRARPAGPWSSGCTRRTGSRTRRSTAPWFAARRAEAELRVIGYDDVVRWVWVRGTPRREDGRLFFDGITTNITEQRELAEERERILEEERQHRVRLEELDRRKDEFLAVASHELRTPLTVINGFVEMLASDDLTDEQREQVSVIQRRTGQLAEMVNLLFDLAKLDAGRARLVSVPLDLAEPRGGLPARPRARGAPAQGPAVRRSRPTPRWTATRSGCARSSTT